MRRASSGTFWPAERRAASALSFLLLLAACGPPHSGDRRTWRLNCQAGLSSPQAGSVYVITIGVPQLAVDDPTVDWEPPSTGAPIYLVFAFVRAQTANLGPIRGGHVRFAVPAGVRREALGIVFATPDGGRWAFDSSRMEFGDKDGVTNAWFELGDGMPDTIPLARALSSASSVSISVTADGQEQLAARFTLDRAARDALAAKAGAMVAAKDPKVCS